MLVSSRLRPADTAGTGGDTRKRQERLIKTCISVFRRGKMRAQPGSAEDADKKGEGCSLLLLCCACRGVWGNQVHTEP